MTSDICRQAMFIFIDKIECNQDEQTVTDEIYNEFNNKRDKQSKFTTFKESQYKFDNSIGSMIESQDKIYGKQLINCTHQTPNSLRSHLKSFGPNHKKSIPLEVCDEKITIF